MRRFWAPPPGPRERSSWPTGAMAGDRGAKAAYKPGGAE
jgi:hypothetical protein